MGLDPPSPVHMRPSERDPLPPPCGRHKWMAPYGGSYDDHMEILIWTMHEFPFLIYTLYILDLINIGKFINVGYHQCLSER